MDSREIKNEIANESQSQLSAGFMKPGLYALAVSPKHSDASSPQHSCIGCDVSGIPSTVDPSCPPDFPQRARTHAHTHTHTPVKRLVSFQHQAILPSAQCQTFSVCDVRHPLWELPRNHLMHIYTTNYTHCVSQRGIFTRRTTLTVYDKEVYLHDEPHCV